MKKNVLVFGLISGLLVSAFMLGSIAWCYNSGRYEGSMLVGYASMILSLSLIYVGVKNYRDKVNGGVITFGQALKMGYLISLIASTCYVVAWMIDYYVFVPDFMEKFAAVSLSKAQHSGLSAKELADKTAEIAQAKEIYSSPFGVIMFTYFEISPVAILVPLISALILKRKNAPADFATA